ncbi:hypothetical protein VPH35_032964 [Triticum aestivum]
MSPTLVLSSNTCQAMSPTLVLSSSNNLQQAGPVRLASSPLMRMRRSLPLSRRRQQYLGLARPASSPIPSPRRKMPPPQQNLPSLAPRSIWHSQEAARNGVRLSSTISGPLILLLEEGNTHVLINIIWFS